MIDKECDGVYYQIKSESKNFRSDDEITKVDCSKCEKEIKVLQQDAISKEGEPEIRFVCSDCRHDLLEFMANECSAPL